MTRLDHVTIAVSDWRTSRDWYVRNLGLKIEFEVPHGGHAGLGVAALQDDGELTLFVEQSAGPIAACGCVLTFQIDGIDATYRALAARGVRFLAPPGKRYLGLWRRTLRP